MRPRHLVLALSALLALALAAAGCGGGGGSESTAVARKPKVESAPKLSKAQFIAQGDSICAEVNTAIGGIAEAETTDTTSQTTQISNLYTGLVQSLQQLGQPSETAGYSEFMGAAEELAMIEGEVKKAAAEEDLVALEGASEEAVPAVEEFQSQAAVYGFEGCAEGPHAPEVAPESSSGEEVPEAVEEEPGGVEVAPEEEFVPEEEEFVPEEEVAPEVEEVAPETGGAGGAIEEVAPEEVAPAEAGESGGVGPG